MIDTKERNNMLDTPLIEGTSNVLEGAELDYSIEVPDGEYTLTLVKMYPWKEITKDTRVNVRDENNRVVRGKDGKPVQEEVKNLTWHMANVVFMVEEGEYERAVVHGSLSTHPNGMGQLKSFMYCAGLFGVSANEIKDNLGVTVGAVVKNKTRSYTDTNTGLEKTITEATVYYYKKPEEVTIYSADTPEL
ncbi:MAG: hypothetical protein M0P69_11280 [Bacteroidales bacterium]|nr:hypothetical protein [Bacteroidales bacterium]